MHDGFAVSVRPRLTYKQLSSTVKNMARLSKVNTENLKIGMYISELDRPWLDSPFLIQGFYVQSSNDIDIISKICGHVFVDTRATSEDISGDMATVSSAIGMDSSGGKTGAKNKAKSSTPGSDSQDNLFADGKRKQYSDKLSLREEIPAARQAVSNLHSCLNDILTRNEIGSPLQITKIKQAVEPMVDSVTRNPDACIWLARMKQEDNYIYEHSLGTSIWAVALGRQLGLPKPDLHSLAIGGLLFDIGKLLLDKGILSANRCLTSNESRIMKKHVEVGVKLLKDGDMENQDVFDMVAHHHERHDGSGYPQGMSGNQIPVFARIAAIVDCYDAITSNRIYAKAISPSLAIKHLYERKNSHFQGELIEEFIQAIGIYPAGTLVELTSGEVAIVAAESRSRRLRPQVMLLLDRDKKPLADIKFIDLRKVTHTDEGQPLNIVNSLEPNAYGIDMSAIEL